MGNGPMPKPSCTNSVPWNGTEEAHVENNSPGAVSADAAAEVINLEKAANKKMDSFEAQGCPNAKDNDCSWLDAARADPIITIAGPVRQPGAKGGKHEFKMAWVCDVKYAWADTINCYKTQKARDDAKAARIAAKNAADKEKEEAAKKAAGKKP